MSRPSEILMDIKAVKAWLKEADYVPVVRCKDCKYFVIAQLKSDYTEDKRYKPSVCINGKYAVPRNLDWFCADGERRDPCS